MKALENRFRFFEPRGICSSSGYIGGASASGISGGSSALTTSILGAVSTAAEDIPLGTSTPRLATPAASAPVSTPTAVSSLGSSSLMTWLVVIAVVVIGVVAFRKL
jgi:hypothetical protein